MLARNEITGNNTYNWEAHVPECGCTGGGKFWQVNGTVVTVDRDTEVKLQAQSEEIYAKGQDSKSAVPETQRIQDVALERALEILKVRPILTGQKEG